MTEDDGVVVGAHRAGDCDIWELPVAQPLWDLPAQPAPHRGVSPDVLLVLGESALAQGLSQGLSQGLARVDPPASLRPAVRTASDGLAALHALAAQTPDVVVLDLEMPCVSGYRLLQLIRHPARPLRPALPQVPVVLLSGGGFQTAREVIRRYLPEGFFELPVAPHVVAELVRHLLSRQLQGPRQSLTVDAPQHVVLPATSLPEGVPLEVVRPVLPAALAGRQR